MGESERKLREVFEAAHAQAKAGHIALVFLDEVGAGGSEGIRVRNVWVRNVWGWMCGAGCVGLDEFGSHLFTLNRKPA